jgi:hypothetical protein
LNPKDGVLSFVLMASLFSKDPTAPVLLPPYALERIEREIAHLRKSSSVRHKPGEKLTVARVASSVAICTLLCLYFMDPFLYAYHKGDAIRTYLYLHNHGSDEKAQALLSTRIFSNSEIDVLNHRDGTFQDYFSSPMQAEQSADSIVNYMNGLYYLRMGQYDSLDPIGKLRYLLFFRTGLLPPTDWSALTPSVAIP